MPSSLCRDPEEQSDCVKVPSLTRTGQYQPMVIKSKASLYGRTNSVRSRLRASLRRKTLAKKFHSEGERDGAAWWEQSSIDIGDTGNNKEGVS